MEKIPISPADRELKGIDNRLRGPADDPGKNNQRNPVADPLFRNLLTQPHDKSRTGRQRDHRHQSKGPTGIQNNRYPRRSGHIFQTDSDAESLNDAQNNRSVTGILGNLSSSRLSFLGKLFQMGNGNRQKLQDNRGTDIGHDPQSKDGQIAQGAPGKHVKEPQ